MQAEIVEEGEKIRYLPTKSRAGLTHVISRSPLHSDTAHLEPPVPICMQT